MILPSQACVVQSPFQTDDLLLLQLQIILRHGASNAHPDHLAEVLLAEETMMVAQELLPQSPS